MPFRIVIVVIAEDTHGSPGLKQPGAPPVETKNPTAGLLKGSCCHAKSWPYPPMSDQTPVWSEVGSVIRLMNSVSEYVPGWPDSESYQATALGPKSGEKLVNFLPPGAVPWLIHVPVPVSIVLYSIKSPALLTTKTEASP